MRSPCVPGGSIGMPTKVTELPDPLPWNTWGFVCEMQPPVPTAQPKDVELPGITLNAVLNSVEFGTFPAKGLPGPAAIAGQPEMLVQVWAALVCPDVGSSTVMIACDWLLELYSRLVTCVFKKIVTLAWGIVDPAGVGVPPLQSNTMSPTS